MYRTKKEIQRDINDMQMEYDDLMRLSDFNYEEAEIARANGDEDSAADMEYEGDQAYNESVVLEQQIDSCYEELKELEEMQADEQY